MTESPDTSALEALRTLLARYVVAIDERRLDELERVFTPDCRVRFGEVGIEGRDALLVHLRENLAHFHETKHVIGEIVAGGATGDPVAPTFRAGVTAWHAFEGDRPTLTLHGYYDDTLARTEDGWRIAVHEGSEISNEQGAARPGGWSWGTSHQALRGPRPQ